MNLQDLYPTFASHCNQKIYATPRFGIFFLFEKENACKRKANSGFHPETPTTPHLSTQLAILSRLLGTFARKRAGA